MTEIYFNKNKRECVHNCSKASYVVQTRYNDKNTGNKVRGGIK